MAVNVGIHSYYQYAWHEYVARVRSTSGEEYSLAACSH